jgi:hypothetical protein
MGWSALTSWIKSWKTIIRYLEPDGLVRIDQLDQVLEDNYPLPEARWAGPLDELDQVLEDNYPLPGARWADPH